MASPSTSLATLRPDLASSFMEYDLEMDRMGFIANRVLPTMEVAQPSGTFSKIPVEQLLQTRDTLRAPGSGYARGKFTFTTDSYATEEHGAEEPIDDKERNLYRDYFDHEVVSTMRARDAVLRNAEIRAAAMVFNTTTWTGASLTTAVSVPWSTAATATPIDDVEAAVLAVYANSGIWPNSLILTRKKFRQLRMADQIKDAIAAGGAGSSNRLRDVTLEQLSAVFDIENIIIAGASKNSANMGQTASVGSIWTDTMAMVAYIAPGNDIRQPTLGRTFHWAEDGSTIGGTVETYREEAVRGDVVRVRHEVDEKIIYPEAGHLLTGL